ncbi:MAG: MarR family transcriptional regulator [Candidatus Cellulosilyticum pullistercoris]|uniref:MarR family transcriptional regulator n=1 Tax=Candidatus Cellulosilyticum pullistercoris TaxID=2838521 RepID=A0A9E2KBJ8_9FIRM|nr:MarR family transcriptional regulator [Candidatus Cellulosilyticum pullistercoris]
MQKMPVGLVMVQIKQLQSRIIEKLLKETLGEASINSAQINIMYQLWNEDNITISELSKRTQLANTSLTTMLERLEAQGQILRCRNDKNRREIRIQLTEHARSLQENTLEILTAMHSINFNGFTLEEEKQMYDFLNRMKSNLETYSSLQK